MPIQEIINLATAILASIGVAGSLILWLSDRLAKILTERILENERQKHKVELAKITSDFERENQKLLADIKHQQEQSIEFVKSDLTIFKEKHLKGFNDKFEVYRLIIDMIAETLGYFDSLTATGKSPTQERLDFLNKARIRIYGYIGMIAPQAVMDAQDKLIDYLIEVSNGKKVYEWIIVRQLSLSLINEIRKDLGVDVNPITYKGKL